MAKVIYDPGTGTFMGLDDCVVVDVPDSIIECEAIEEYLESTIDAGKIVVEVSSASAP